jgi:hypothetical protein
MVAEITTSESKTYETFYYLVVCRTWIVFMVLAVREIIWKAKYTIIYKGYIVHMGELLQGNQPTSVRESCNSTSKVPSAVGNAHTAPMRAQPDPAMFSVAGRTNWFGSGIR